MNFDLDWPSLALGWAIGTVIIWAYRLGRRHGLREAERRLGIGMPIQDPPRLPETDAEEGSR